VTTEKVSLQFDKRVESDISRCMSFDLAPEWKVTLPFRRKIGALFIGLLLTARPVGAQTWIQRHPSGNSGEYFQSIACSSNASTLVVVSSSAENTEGTIGQIFVSTNFGVTWRTNSAPPNWWSAVACSADGTKMVASALGTDDDPSSAGIYTSTDSGATWQQRTSYPIVGTEGLYSSAGTLASSADGTKLVLAVGGMNGIYLSSDSGATWQRPTTQNVTTNGILGVASSADGTKLVATGYTYTEVALFNSSDSGATWAQYNLPLGFSNVLGSVASSADGHKLVGTGSGIYTSSDYGVTWQKQSGAPSGVPRPGFWATVAASADGTRLVVGGQLTLTAIYTSLDSGVTWVSNNVPAGPWFSVASSADGKKLAAVPMSTGLGIFTVQTDLGYVFCLCNSNGIPGASVQIGTNVITTGGDGAYSLTNVPPGTYAVKVSATNYTTLITNLTITAGQPVPNFYLTNTTLIITPVFGSSITSRSDSDTISNSISAAIQVYSQYIADPICVKIYFANITDGLGQSTSPQSSLAYSTYLDDLMQSTNLSANDITALASLPMPLGTGLWSNSVVRLTAANLDAIGEHALAAATRANLSGLNSVIELNFSELNTSRPGQDTNLYDLQSTVLHEVDEVLGIGGNGTSLALTTDYSGQIGPTNVIKSLDLYRYVATGFRSFSLSPNDSAYFSIKGGANVLVYFNQQGYTSVNGSQDFGDWGDGTNPADGMGNVPSQVQDAVGTPGAAENLGANELIALDVIGYTLIGKSTILNSFYLGGHTFTFSFATAPGQTYQIQSTASLVPSTSWSNLGAPFVATDITSNFTDTNAIGIKLYYRVNAIPPTNAAPLIASKLRPALAPAESPVETTIETHRFFPRP
jgi:Carboxypeptidase regulatory-like domain